MKITLEKSDACEAELDVFAECAYLHVTVHRWSKDLMRHLMWKWGEIAPVVTQYWKVYVYTDTHNDRFVRFVGRFGFKDPVEAKGLLVYEYKGQPHG